MKDVIEMPYKEGAMKEVNNYISAKGYEALAFAIYALEREEAGGCTGCAFESTEEWEMPCAKCKRNCKDYWRAKA